MAVTKYTQEIKARVSAKRMYKAIITESQNVLVKIMPNAVKSVHLLQGDGIRVGTVKLTNFADGAPYSYVKIRIEDIDDENCWVKYALIEGPMLEDKLEKVYYEQKFEDTSDGGCLITLVSYYHTKGDVQLKEEDIKAGKDQANGYYTLIEEYLSTHPDVCA